jgi:hypothetical protein
MFTNQPVLWGEFDTHTKAIREFSIENRKKGRKREKRNGLRERERVERERKKKQTEKERQREDGNLKMHWDHPWWEFSARPA